MQVQVHPKFPGNVMKYIADSIRYPEEARVKNIQGKVYISFIIEKNGSVSNVTVLRADNTVLIHEAKRVVYAMPKWTPGKNNGVPVRVKETMAVAFNLK
jgi:periplasmic protein TonB